MASHVLLLPGQTTNQTNTYACLVVWSHAIACVQSWWQPILSVRWLAGPISRCCRQRRWPLRAIGLWGELTPKHPLGLHTSICEDAPGSAYSHEPHEGHMQRATADGAHVYKRMGCWNSDQWLAVCEGLHYCRVHFCMSWMEAKHAMITSNCSEVSQGTEGVGCWSYVMCALSSSFWKNQAFAATSNCSTSSLKCCAAIGSALYAFLSRTTRTCWCMWGSRLGHLSGGLRIQRTANWLLFPWFSRRFLRTKAASSQGLLVTPVQQQTEVHHRLLCAHHA